MAFATASQIRNFPNWRLRPRRKQEISQIGICYRVANKKFPKLAFATASQTRNFPKRRFSPDAAAAPDCAAG